MRRRRAQAGYMLLVILVMLALLMISLTVVAPAIATEIKREREEELTHRGQQYARAIKRYFKKFGRYPTRVEDLENTSNLRFLRKRYLDPITGKDDWRLIHVGEAKIVPRTFTQGGVTGAPQGTPTGFGAPGGTPTGIAPVNPSMGMPGFSAPGGSTMGSTLGGSSAGRPILGGGPIIGVSSSSEQRSLKEMDGKDHYNEWEFVYDPRFDPTVAAGMGQQLGRPGQPGQPQFPAMPLTPGTPPPPPKP